LSTARAAYALFTYLSDEEYSEFRRSGLMRAVTPKLLSVRNTVNFVIPGLTRTRSSTPSNQENYVSGEFRHSGLDPEFSSTPAIKKATSQVNLVIPG
jgi:hypothetical protein